MKKAYRQTVYAILVIALILSGCSSTAFFRPPGEKIGSCEGRIDLADSGRTRFRVDAFSRDGDVTLWFSLPNRGVRYRQIEDIDFNDGTVVVETKSPRRIYEGAIAGDKLKFSGRLDGFSGAFELNFDK